VTGGAGGIGRAYCEELLKHGAKVRVWTHPLSYLQRDWYVSYMEFNVIYSYALFYWFMLVFIN
jgi:nucleoside-diphosphate-sugar epimerase